MLVLFAAVLPVIILFCGLAIDVGMLQLKQLQMQSAADAAALGAELQWERTTDYTTQGYTTQAQADAAVNGFTNGSNNVTVAVSNPPGMGDYGSYFDVVGVTITQKVNTIFMGALNGGQVTLSAQAGAMMPPCVYITGATNLAGTYSLSGTNSGNFYPRCPMYINQNVVTDGTSNLDGSTAFNVTGAVGGSSIQGPNYPPPRYGALTMPDPLASVPSPSFSSYSSCTKTSYSLSGGNATLNPGLYCGTSSTKGMTLSNATVTLNPGLYVITGGAHWTESTVSGTGVTLFFTKGNGAQYGQFVIDAPVGYSYINLSAPITSSNLSVPTILFFGDRNWVHTSAQDFQWNRALFVGDGIWYFTGTGVSIINCGSLYATHYLALVVDSFYAQGTDFGLFTNFSIVPTGNPFRTKGVLVQ